MTDMPRTIVCDEIRATGWHADADCDVPHRVEELLVDGLVKEVVENTIRIGASVNEVLVQKQQVKRRAHQLHRPRGGTAISLLREIARCT